MKRSILIIFILFSSAFTYYSKAQDEDIKVLFEKFVKLYNSGDLVGAENCLLLILNSKNPLSEEYKVAAYNNLGATCTFIGKYIEALDYYSKAENLISNNQKTPDQLAAIYINKAIIYGYQKSYPLAIEYFEKGIRIYLNQNSSEEKSIPVYHLHILNFGIVYLEIGNYKSALDYFKKSAEIKLKFNLPGWHLFILTLLKHL